MGHPVTPDGKSRPRVIHFRCGSCGKELKASAELVGRKARCACGQVVSIIDGAATGTATPHAPAGASERPSAVMAEAPPPGAAPAAAPASPAATRSPARACHFCGRGAADPAAEAITILLAKTKAAQESAEQEVRLKASGAAVPREVYKREKAAGYAQIVRVPRCKACQRVHDKPGKIALLTLLFAALLTVLISFTDYWPSFGRVASEAASTKADLGSEDLAQVFDKLGALKASHTKREGSEIKLSPLYAWLMAAVFYLAPALVLALVVWACVNPVHIRRARQRGIKWKGDTMDLPFVKEQVALGWE